MKAPTGVPTVLMTRRPHFVVLVVATVLPVLVLPVGAPGGWRDAAAQSNTVSLRAWTCPSNIDTGNPDPSYFASTCTEPAAGLDFVLTRDGRPSTRTTGADGRTRPPWSAVTGPFALRADLPNGETVAVFCAQNGDPEPVMVENDAISGDLAPGTRMDCTWYLVRLAATPPAGVDFQGTGVTAELVVIGAASPEAPIPPSVTPVPTAAAPTETPVPATNTPVPTVVEPTATATQAAALATATAAQALFAAGEPDISMPWPHGLQYQLGDRFMVYPEPGSGSEWVVEDFVAEAVFVNPSDDRGGTWDYGFLFGPAGTREDYRLYVDADRRWVLERGSTTVQSGPLDGLNLGAGESNTLRLIVSQGTALLYANAAFVATLDVSAANDGGTLWLITSVQGERIVFNRADVWHL